MEEEEDPDEPEVPFLQRLRNVCYKKFCEDTDEANYVKGILLGLGSGVIPTQVQIDQSELFQERSSDKTAPVANVSNAWMPVLEESLWLAMEAPDKMKHKDGTTPLYKFKDLMRLVPSAAGSWTAKSAKPALVAVVPPPPRLPWRPLLVWKAYITWLPYTRRPFQSCLGILRRKPNSSPFVVTAESKSRILRRTLTTSGTTSTLNYSVETVMGRLSS